jgi:hypothetical protein
MKREVPPDGGASRFFQAVSAGRPSPSRPDIFPVPLSYDIVAVRRHGLPKEIAQIRLKM